MSTPLSGGGKGSLERIAYRVMEERGFLPYFSRAVFDELNKIEQPHEAEKSVEKDLRHMLWASIDNDDSLDLDQLTVAESLSEKAVKILVAVADVDAVVKRASAIDDHARQNTTTVYTAGRIFPMIPEKLSTDLTSLNAGEDRLAVI